MDTAEPPRPSALQAFLRQDPVAGYGFVPATFKRRVPALRPGLVSRSELIGRLRAAEGDVIAVAAPAGYGKSTLLAEWAAADERPVAWLTLDASDDDPGLLVTYLSLALDEIEPVGAAVVADFWGKAPPVPPVALSRFARMLAERRTPLLLVLDDVHELHAPEALDVLAILVASLPAGSSLALVGRSMPPLPFGRMRVKRTVVEVGPPDLALTGTQAATMFSGLGLRLTTAEVATLVERTEGWPAGLYLAALALQGREDDDTATAIAGFAGDHRLVADYLRDELLVDLDPEVVTFLLGASCLERLSGSLCDAVLERSGSGALLDDLQRGNLLVIPLDDRREWFRLHHLLVDLLQAELDRRHPGAARAIHRRASAWFEAAGHADDAITHAVRAGESARAEALVHGSFARYSSHGRHATIQRWLELFSPEELAVQPLLAVIATWSRWFAGDGDGAARWLARTEELVADRHPPDADGWVPPVALAVLRASLARIPAAEMADEALYAGQRLPVGEWRAMAVLLRGAAEFMLGNEDLAAELIDQAAAEAVGAPNVRAVALAHLAAIHVEHGDWESATADGRAARHLMAEHGLEQVPGLYLVTAVSSSVEARAGRLAEAEDDRLLTRHHLTRMLPVAPYLNLQARVALVRTNLQLGDLVAARMRLDEADALLAFVPDAVRVKDQLAELRRDLAGHGSDAFGPSSLTVSELRVLQYLPTHLSMAEIAERLYISRNTVKSHAVAIYRKLGTASRGAAVQVAEEAGLFEDPRR